MILNESQYSNSVQKYGKDLTDIIIKNEPYLSQRFLMKMCEFTYVNKIPFENVRSLFSRIQEYGLNIPNINTMSYQELCEIANKTQQNGKTLLDNPHYLSSDGMVEIYLVHNYEEVKRLPFNNSWCIKDEGDYNYHAFDISTTMYLIHNKHFSKRSNMRYVMAEVYPKNEEEGEHTIYWETNNDILNGATLTNYIKSLGEGADRIQLIPLEETVHRRLPLCNNNQRTSNPTNNRETIIISESKLHLIVADALRSTLMKYYK